MTVAGWIKLYRDLLEWEYMFDTDTFTVYAYLLMMANFRDTEWHGQKLAAGQLITSVASIMGKFHFTERHTRTILGRLTKCGKVQCKATNKYTVVTLTEWGLQADQGIKTDGQTDEQTDEQTDNSRRIIRPKEYKEFISPPPVAVVNNVENDGGEMMTEGEKIANEYGLIRSSADCKTADKLFEQYGSLWFTEACRRANEAGQNNWKYVRGILKRWTEQGYMDGESRIESFAIESGAKAAYRAKGATTAQIAKALNAHFETEAVKRG